MLHSKATLPLFPAPLQEFNSPNHPLSSAEQYQLKYIKPATAIRCHDLRKKSYR